MKRSKGLMILSLQKSADFIFLTLTVWREARGEPVAVKAAVAHSILNRVNRPSWWGKDIMGVVFKKWQYSSLTDPKDPQLTTWPKADETAWQECLVIASNVMKGLLENPVPGADSYYDISIQAPYWAKDEAFVCQIGRVRFYNLDNDYEIEEAKVIAAGLDLDPLAGYIDLLGLNSIAQMV